jgi:putative DNA primase/helicase
MLPEGQDLSDVFLSDPEGFQRFLIGSVAAASPVVGADVILMERDLSLFPLTDLGNARFTADFAAREGTPLRYVEEMGFVIYAGGVWRADHLDRSRAIVHRTADRVKAMADALQEAASTDEASAEANRWSRWADYCQSKRGIDSALSELVALPSVATRVSELDKHHHLLVVRNGVVDLRTGNLQEHNQELLMTKRVEVDYDAEAKAPRWESYLSEVMLDDAEMVDYLRRLVGYAITGETSEQCFTVLWGSGANGKTVLTSTLQEVFKAISVTTPFSTFEQKAAGGIPNDLAALRAARLVFASEGNADQPMNEALLKQITGRDPVTARFLRKEFFTFTPRFQIFLATNKKPMFVGADEGLWRRVKMIAWARYFTPEERDAGIFEALLDEAEGILAWAVRGAVEWYAGGLQDPAAIVEATKDYKANSDVLAGFLPGMYVRDDNAGTVPGKTLFDDYLSWAADENLKPTEIVKRRKMYSMLEERGVVRHAVREGAAFSGIRRARPSDWVEA